MERMRRRGATRLRIISTKCATNTNRHKFVFGYNYDSKARGCYSPRLTILTLGKSQNILHFPQRFTLVWIKKVTVKGSQYFNGSWIKSKLMMYSPYCGKTDFAWTFAGRANHSFPLAELKDQQKNNSSTCAS